MKEKIYKICTQLNDGQIAVTEATQQILDLFAVSEDIDSEDFQQWMISVDDDETDIEELHKEYLAEKRANEESRKLGWR